MRLKDWVIAVPEAGEQRWIGRAGRPGELWAVESEGRNEGVHGALWSPSRVAGQSPPATSSVRRTRVSLKLADKITNLFARR